MLIGEQLVEVDGLGPADDEVRSTGGLLRRDRAGGPVIVRDIIIIGLNDALVSLVRREQVAHVLPGIMIEGQQGVERRRELLLAGDGEELTIESGVSRLGRLAVGDDDHIDGGIGDVFEHGRCRCGDCRDDDAGLVAHEEMCMGVSMNR